MILLPYYTKHTSLTGTSAVIHALHLLTVGGQALWEEDDSLRMVEDVMEPNGIYLMEPPVQVPTAPSVYLCRVDPVRTHIQDFYRWSEIPKEDHETICWRSFYRCGSTPLPEQERLGAFSVKTVCGWIDGAFSLPDAMAHFNLNT